MLSMCTPWLSLNAEVLKRAPAKSGNMERKTPRSLSRDERGQVCNVDLA